MLVIGDGAAGVIIANKTRLRVAKSDLEIIVVGKSPEHYFRPDGIQIPVGLKDYRTSIKPTRFLLNYDVDYVRDEVTGISTADRKVKLQSGRELNFDFLVIATGNRFTPEDMPGYSESAKHFYDLEHALALRTDIEKFTGGDIVIGRASEPIMCPPAPFEMTLLLDSYFRRKGIRDKVTLSYLYPLDSTYSLPNVAKILYNIFDERNIKCYESFNAESIDPEGHRVNSYEGESVKFDLLIMIPPHRGQQVMTDSGLADEYGYIDVDKRHLNYKDYDDIFVIGDATNLPLSKAGSVAHLQSDFLSGYLAAKIVGGQSEDGYDGLTACFAETGMGEGLTMYYSHTKKEKAYFTSSVDHLLKWSSSYTYFSTMVRGIA